MKRNAPKAKWKSISIKKALQEKWDWQKLLETTNQFISENADHYDGAVVYTWQENDPDRDKLARVCWNTLGWQRPSGPVGKSTSAGSHESSQFAGFGAEEWLFNFERLIDGFHYGFLQPINSGTNGEAYAGRDFNIRLFTRNEATGDYYHVGRIVNAHVLTQEEREAAEAVYRRKGWAAKMQQELVEAGGLGTIEMGESGQGPFNIRFRPVAVERPDTADGLDLIEDIDLLTKSRRYKLFKDLGGHSVPPVIPPGGGIAKVVLKDRRPKEEKERRRQIQGGQIELAGLHDKVQDRLVSWLRKTHPKQQVSKEAYIEPYGTRIDVVLERPNDGLTFYEVKVLPTIKACIREALGQLLEYAHWTANDLSQEWVIVSYHPVNDSINEYLEKLGTTYGLPVSYLQITLQD